jgi:hypothetical protein
MWSVPCHPHTRSARSPSLRANSDWPIASRKLAFNIPANVTGEQENVCLDCLGADAPDAPDATASLVFMHQNHDDLLLIVERVRKSTGLDCESAAATAIGLKLLAEVMLKQRDNPLFDALRTPMRQFIHTLKSVGERTDR